MLETLITRLNERFFLFDIFGVKGQTQVQPQISVQIDIQSIVRATALKSIEYQGSICLTEQHL